MNWYEVREEVASAGRLKREVRRAWSLPGVICDACSATWATTGLEFPSVDLSMLLECEELVEPRVVPFSEYEQLAGSVSRHLDNRKRYRPGSGFGRLSGTVFGELTDFLILNVVNLVVSLSAGNILDQDLRENRLVDTNLFLAEGSDRYLEIELEPLGEMIDRIERTKQCSKCERIDITLPEKIVVDRRSIPESSHLFRLRNFPSVMVASDQFVEKVIACDLTGLTFENLEAV